MKAISLQQPWATLVAIGAKRIETRSWATKFRGQLAIHASKSYPKQNQDLFWKTPFKLALTKPGKYNIYISPLELPLGLVVATCRLVNCFKIHVTRPEKRDGEIVMTAFLEAGNSLIEVSGNELVFGDYTPGRYAWILEDVNPLPEPVPARGKLGLWEWEPEGIGMPECNPKCVCLSCKTNPAECPYSDCPWCSGEGLEYETVNTPMLGVVKVDPCRHFQRNEASAYEREEKIK